MRVSIRIYFGQSINWSRKVSVYPGADRTSVIQNVSNTPANANPRSRSRLVSRSVEDKGLSDDIINSLGEWLQIRL